MEGSRGSGESSFSVGRGTQVVGAVMSHPMGGQGRRGSTNHSQGEGVGGRLC